ncbi:MAG: FixH family protein [Pseudomonadota bacterium]
MIKELKGHHVLAIALTAFAVIITANMAMLFAATGSFPGLVVKNSYVASQGWNARTEAQQALGWSSEIDYADGRLTVRIRARDGAAIDGLALTARIGRPTTDTLDQSLEFQALSEGYAAPITLNPGVWRVDIKTRSGPAFEKTAELYIPGNP